MLIYAKCPDMSIAVQEFSVQSSPIPRLGFIMKFLFLFGKTGKKRFAHKEILLHIRALGILTNTNYDPAEHFLI